MILGFAVSASFPWAVTRFTTIGESTYIRPGLLGNFAVGALACAFFFIADELGILRIDQDSNYKTIVFLIMATITLLSLSNVFQGYLLGTFRFGSVALLRVGGAIAQLVVGLTLVILGAGAEGALAGYISAAFVSLFIGFWISKGALRNTGSWINLQFTYFALTLMIGILGIHLIINLDQLAVKMFSPASSANVLSANYKAARLICTLPLYVITSFIGAIFPISAEYSSDPKQLGFYVRKMLKHVFAFILPTYIALIVVPKEILGVIFPSEYTTASQALSVLSPGVFLLILVAIFTAVLQGSGSPRRPAVIVGMAIVFQSILLYILVPRYDIVGASIATTISSGLALVGLVIYYPKKFRLTPHWMNTLKIVCASISMVIAIYIFPMTSLISVAIGIVFGYLVFLLTLILSMYFDSEDKRLFLFIMERLALILRVDPKQIVSRFRKPN
tara:strand:+ start:1136 stop:2476 length:1341 start_codon:yes stop_codon:yes gene_type:complete